jgi:hypothetical protein
MIEFSETGIVKITDEAGGIALITLREFRQASKKLLLTEEESLRAEICKDAISALRTAASRAGCDNDQAAVAAATQLLAYSQSKQSHSLGQ